MWDKIQYSIGMFTLGSLVTIMVLLFAGELGRREGNCRKVTLYNADGSVQVWESVTDVIVSNGVLTCHEPYEDVNLTISGNYVIEDTGRVLVRHLADEGFNIRETRNRSLGE